MMMILSIYSEEGCDVDGTDGDDDDENDGVTNDDDQY